jgi:2-haloacid dehalogenase
MPITTCVFDAYGTLFDVAAAARQAAAEPGREDFAAKWPAIARTWRLKQLQYTWLRATAGVHQDFWTVTQNGLDYALEEQGMADPGLQYTWLRATAGVHQDFWTVTQNGLDYALEEQGMADPGLRERLLQLYWELSAYPEVPAMLAALKAAGGGGPEHRHPVERHAGHAGGRGQRRWDRRCAGCLPVGAVAGGLQAAPVGLRAGG